MSGTSDRQSSFTFTTWAVVLGAGWLYLSDRSSAAWLDDGLDLAGADGELLVAAAHVAAASCAAIAGAVVLAVSRRARARVWWGSAPVAAALAAPAGVWLGASLARGAWLARQPVASALPWLVGIGFAVVGAGLGLAVAHPLPRWRWRVAFAWVGLSLGATVADVRVFPGLYPDAHLVLYATSVVAALLAARAILVDRTPSRAARLGAPILAVTCLCGIVAWGVAPSASRGAALAVSVSANNLVTRFLPPLGGAWLRRELSRPPRVIEASRAASSGSFFAPSADTNVVLIVVDTLRADALPPARTGRESFVRRGDTPFLDRWLAGAYRFRRAYAQATRTQYSMPPLFRSAEPFEDVDRPALPLASLFAQLGRVPVAVVPQYFLMPFEKSSRRLLDGFAHVAFYEKNHQDRMLDEVRTTLAAVQDRPFFAWFHVYNQHQPYYAGRSTGRRDGSVADRYRLALRWLDGQLCALVDLLEKQRLRERTIIVLAADHGENLEDGRNTGHGATVRDAEARVPLAIWVPGKPGALIDATVGNIDIVPTVLDLLGVDPLPEHRGRSLVALLADPRTRHDRAYYLRSGSGRMHGLVLGSQKLVFSEASGLFTRRDLARDPRERRNAFRERNEVDIDLVGRMVRKNPAVARAELDEAEVRALLIKRLDASLGASVDPSLEFLLRTAALTDDAQVRAAAERLFQRAPSVQTRIAIVEHLETRDARHWSKLLAVHLAAITDPNTLRDAVATLARRGQPPLAVPWVQSRLRALAVHEPVEWTPWLRLVLPWPKRGRVWTAAFEPVLQAADGRDLPATTAALLFENLATLTKPSAKLRASIRVRVTDPDPAVAAAACQALGRLGQRRDAAALRKRLGAPNLDPRVRQAILHALARLEGDDALRVIVKLGRDPLLTVDAVKALGKLGSAKAVPFLRDVANKHYNAYTRGEARKALKRIASH